MSRPVARKKLSWLVFWETGIGSLSRVMTAAGVAIQTARTLVTEAEVEDHDDDLTVLRVIGEYGFFVENAATAVDRPYQHECGIMARESIDAGSVTPSLALAAVAEEYPWSWLRTWNGLPDGVSSQGQHGMLDAITPGTALEKVDIRVKRKLRSGDELYWITNSQIVPYGGNLLPANADLFLHDWLRVRILVES